MARAEGPMKFLDLESLKCHFVDFEGSFDRIRMLRIQSFSTSHFALIFIYYVFIDVLEAPPSKFNFPEVTPLSHH